jgi:hypothetical protein
MFKEIDYDKHILIGTPLVGWKVQKNEHNQWISDIARIRNKFKNARFFAALEVDARGVAEYGSFIDELQNLDIDFWTYSINDGEYLVTSQNRWIRIETGRNLVREYAQRLRRIESPHWGEEIPQMSWVNYDAVLYVDSDISLTCEVLEKLLEVDHYMVSADVPIYGLSGDVVNENPRIEEHWNTAGLLLVNSPQYYDLPWYSNRYLNLSDDPTFQHLAKRLYGSLTWVRKDIQAQHMPVDAVENRNIEPRVI